MNEFIFTWFVENYSFCWHNSGQILSSPMFTADAFERTSWDLGLYPSGESSEEYISVYLFRNTDDGPETFSLNFQLSFLAADGTLLESLKILESKHSFKKNGEEYGSPSFANRCKVLIEKSDVYLPQDTLTVQCRMWKGTGDVSDTSQSFARTRIGVKHVSFVARVEGFSGIPLDQKKNIPIKSSEIRSLMTMDVSLTDGLCCDEKVMVEILPLKCKFVSCKLSLLRVGDDGIECGQGEASFQKNKTKPLKLLLPFSKKVLMERKNEYLPEDSLSLQCDATFSTGIEINKVERTVCGRQWMLKPVAQDGSKCKVCENLQSLGGAVGDMGSFYNDQIMSDIKLNTKTESFPAHKTVLCARSPVFRSMFTNDMKEKTSDCIEVPDLEDDTVRQFLLFLYTDTVEDLEWDIAIKLYYVADKYQVQRLKKVCSSFLIDNLNTSNVSELLVLADMHQDANLTKIVEGFILQHEEKVFGSDKWETFMKTNPHLAMMTMHLKYKKKV